MNPRVSRLSAFVLVVLALAACNRDEVTGVPPLSASSSAAANTLRNVIVFAAEEPGARPQLALINPDGSGRQLLINDPQHGYTFPAVSPDGRRIAYGRYRSDGMAEGIFVVNADGSGQSLVIHHSSQFDGEPSWSPDGSKIVFMSLDDSPFGAVARIYVVGVDGSGLRKLSPPIDEATEYAFDEGPSWSPDGARIAFTRNAQLYVINADGTGFAALPNDDSAIGPSWSPDGTRIAYTSLNPFGDIHIRNADGSHLTAVTATPDQEGGPRWAGDGNRLVFVRYMSGRTQIFVTNADGSGETRLSFGTSDNAPDWSHFPSRRSGVGASIVIVPNNAKAAPGETRQFTASVQGTNGEVLANAKVTWASSDSSVATVTASGVVTAHANGTVQISASFGDATAGALLRVADRVLRNAIVYGTDAFGSADKPELAVVAPDGSGRRRLTIDQFGYHAPDISPDGQRIAYPTFAGIVVMPVDATGITDTFTDLFIGFDAAPDNPAWSPDGSQVALSAIVAGAFGPVRRILVINADGTAVRQVSPDDPAADDGPTWSPDGTRLIFTRNGVLHVINADGTGLTSLANDDPASTPDWSPDGTRVVYGSPNGIRIRNADGTNPATVTTQAGDGHPRWAPDNQRLVFARVVNGKSQVFIINADGTGEVKLSATAANESQPTWSPVP